ncbi:MAG: uracil-DNA glycosylase [Bacteroidales bacterium]|nr:uracil-DNA glycosylase [Bacteroidales bacterium]
MKVKIEESWREVLQTEFDKEYFENLVDFVRNAYKTILVYPKGNKIFNAFNLCSFKDTKVVIIGQDPYHEEGQAHGLCFSVPKDINIPPSLVNIYKEIENDLGIKPSNNGDLTRWAQQGVLLLNSTLTVEAHKAGSHQNKGWEVFTDAVIKILSEKKEHLVFLLWGAFAIKKSSLIDKTKHLVLSSPHPSPLSAYRGFFGNKHFSKTNEYLIQNNISPIQW